jgi:transposase
VDALIKLGTVATDIMGVSGRAMLEALMAGQRDPKVLAELARGRMRGKRAALVAALTGRFDDHHAELARMLLDHIDALGIQIDRLTSRIQELIGAIPAAQPPGDGAGPSGAGTAAATTGTQDTDQPLTPTPNPTPLSALQRLDEVPGIGAKAAQVLIAELGLDMGQFPPPGSWCRGPGCHPGPSSPAPNAAPAPPARATPTAKACSARSPPRPPRPTPSPGRALPPPGPAHRQAQGPGRHRPVGPGDRLAPAGRPHHPLL